MISSTNLIGLTLAAHLTIGLVLSGAVQQEQHNSNLAIFESPALRMISDEDQANMQHIKHHIESDFSNFKTINEVHAFLDKVKLLIQKHPKNVAFAQADLKDLHKFLSQDIITRLIRVDAEPFIMPIGDDRVAIAQRAVDDDELTRKLFGGPLRSMIETKRQQMNRTEDGNHKDGNFFTNFWCRISGGCSN